MTEFERLVQENRRRSDIRRLNETLKEGDISSNPSPVGVQNLNNFVTRVTGACNEEDSPSTIP